MAIPQLLFAGGKLGLKALPFISAAAGAAPGIRKGNVGEAVLGGAGGYFTGVTGKGLTQALTKPAARMAGGMGLQNLLGTAAGQIGGLGAQKAVMGALTPQALQRAALIGVPLAGIGLTGKAAGIGETGGAARGSGMGLGGLAGGGAGLLGYGSVRGEPMTGLPLPVGMGSYGNIGPTGLPLDVLSPLGLDAGLSLIHI